jgi:hypothetical protein
MPTRAPNSEIKGSFDSVARIGRENWACQSFHMI